MTRVRLVCGDGNDPIKATPVQSLAHSWPAASAPSKAAAYFSLHIRRVSRIALGEPVVAAVKMMGVRAAIVVAAAIDVSHAVNHGFHPAMLRFRFIGARICTPDRSAHRGIPHVES